MIYTIGEIANLLGIPTSTLRFYDKKGLLPFVERSKSGIRVFTESDFQWLKVIECLKKTGMQLKDIKAFIDMAMQGDATIDARYELIVRQKEIVENQIAELQQTLDVLTYKQWYYYTAKQSGTTNTPQNMSIDDIPEPYRSIKLKLEAPQK
ncbi:MAG: MerR family transcriptional regulator [Acutalibacteraceae bacterium]